MLILKKASSAANKTFFVIFAAFLLGSICLKTPVYADDISSKTQAVFVFNLLKMVTWPEGKSLFSKYDAKVCLDSNYKFSKTLEYIAKKRKLNIDIIPITPDWEFGLCHIIFLGKNQEQFLSAFKANKEFGVLIIGSKPNLYKSGGMISLYFRSNKLEIYINKTQLNRAGMKVKNKLLRFAVTCDEKLT